MTSKERVLKTINHQEPDRVPTGEFGIDHDHVERIIGRPSYWRNRKEQTLGFWEGKRDVIVESLKADYGNLVDALDWDVITVPAVPPKGYQPDDPPRKIADGVWQDNQGRTYRYAASNDSIQCMTPLLAKEVLQTADIDQAYQRVEELDESRFELVDYFVREYGKTKAVLFRGIDIYNALMWPFGGDQTHQLMLSATNPQEIKKMYGPALEYNRKIIDYLARQNVPIALQGYDFCMNTGCFMSPATLRDVYFPFQKLVADELKKADIIPFFHCCGKTWDILDDYIAAGYVGYQSIQSSAGMDLERMKTEYGQTLTLWAGIQCETLIDGRLEDIEREVTRSLEVLMPGGGFIFGSTNSVQYGAKTDNYLKALEIVKGKGVY